LRSPIAPHVSLGKSAAASFKNPGTKKRLLLSEEGSVGGVAEEASSQREPPMRGQQRKRRRWTVEEEEALMEGVMRYGSGNWKKILASAGESLAGRTAVDLKDKWRNMDKQTRKITELQQQHLQEQLQQQQQENQNEEEVEDV
jgi:hypothetical protein